MNQLFQRMLRAAKLDLSLYEEVEADKSALLQAMLVVILSSISAGLGLATLRNVGHLIVIVVAALVGWLVWACIVYFVGVKILPTPETKSDLGELLRTIGFSSSPGVIRIIGIIPGLYNFITLCAQIWMLIAMVIAVRQALDYKSTGRAVLVCVTGWIIQILILVFISMAFGPKCVS